MSETTITAPDLVSVGRGAELLGGLSPWTIRRWLSEGKIRRFKIGARTFVDKSDLLSMVRCETRAEAAARNIERARESKPLRSPRSARG